MTANRTYKPEKVLLSGASRMLGSALGETLQEGGAEIIQLVRRAPMHSSQMRWEPKKELSGQQKSFEGLAAAIHLSGANVSAHRWTEAYRREIRESRVVS